jgi:hypothetical protein
MRSWGKKILAGGSFAVLLGSVLVGVVGSGSSVGATTPTTFTITANNSSSAAVDLGSAATLAESGLPNGATGSVTFSTSSNPDLCTTTLPAPACNSPVTLTTGTYQVTAGYSGDTSFSSSTSTNTVSLTILAPTTTVASASPSTAVEGTSITYSATVTSSYATPTGTVNFRTPARGLCSAVLSGSTASCSATTAPIGTTNVTALYVGDGTSDKSFGMTTVTISRSTPSLTCAKVNGKTTTSIKLAVCSPFSGANRTATAPGSFLSSGGTLTWSRSLQTSVVSLTASSPGQGACPRKFVEHDLSGQVTGGTSLYTLALDPVSIRVCESTRTHVVKLVAGTQAGL